MAAWKETLESPQAVAAALWQRAPQLLTVLCVAYIAIQLGVAVTFQAPQAGAAGGAVAALPATPAVQASTIINAHLFGLFKSQAPDAASAPQTTMPLVLTGVIATADPEHGQAIIGPDAGSAKLYSTGDDLPAGVRLHSVYNDRVLLERNGSLEALLLPRPQASQVAVVGTTSAASSGGQRLQVMAQNNPALIGGLMRTQPVFIQGKLAGYRIFPAGGRASAQAFNELGLRSGDLITAVNGTPLDDPNRSAEVLQTLSSAATASVTVLRGGVAQEIALNLDTVADQVENAASELPQRPGGFAGPRGGFFGPRFGLRRGAPDPGTTTSDDSAADSPQ